MNEPKAFEAGMAGSAGLKSVLADPFSLATKPPVIFKFASALLALIVYSCVSAAMYNGKCLFNNYNGVCMYGSLTLISFMACVALLALEITFGHISSLKIRRRVAIGDVIFFGINTIYYILLFLFLSIAWLKSEYPPFGISINCCRVAILLSFLAIFASAACAGLAYVRYQSGVDMSQFMTEEQLAQEQAQYYDHAGNYQQQSIQGDPDYAVDPAQYGAQQGSYMNYDQDIRQ